MTPQEFEAYRQSILGTAATSPASDGGFLAAIKNTLGRGGYGVGDALMAAGSDTAGPALREYSKGVMDANPIGQGGFTTGVKEVLGQGALSMAPLALLPTPAAPLAFPAMLAMTAAQTYGGMRSDQEKEGITERGRAALMTVPETAVEFGIGKWLPGAKKLPSFVQDIIGGGIEGKAVNIALRKAVDEGSETGVNQALKTLSKGGMLRATEDSYLKHGAKAFAKQGASESFEELVQSPIETFSVKGTGATGKDYRENLLSTVKQLPEIFTGSGLLGGGIAHFDTKETDLRDQIAAIQQAKDKEHQQFFQPSPPVRPNEEVQAMLDEQADARAAEEAKAAHLQSFITAGFTPEQAAVAATISDALKPKSKKEKVAEELNITPEEQEIIASLPQEAQDKLSKSAKALKAYITGIRAVKEQQAGVDGTLTIPGQDTGTDIKPKKKLGPNSGLQVIIKGPKGIRTIPERNTPTHLIQGVDALREQKIAEITAQHTTPTAEEIDDGNLTQISTAATQGGENAYDAEAKDAKENAPNEITYTAPGGTPVLKSNMGESGKMLYKIEVNGKDSWVEADKGTKIPTQPTGEASVIEAAKTVESQPQETASETTIPISAPISPDFPRRSFNTAPVVDALGHNLPIVPSQAPKEQLVQSIEEAKAFAKKRDAELEAEKAVESTGQLTMERWLQTRNQKREMDAALEEAKKSQKGRQKATPFTKSDSEWWVAKLHKAKSRGQHTAPVNELDVAPSGTVQDESVLIGDAISDVLNVKRADLKADPNMLRGALLYLASAEIGKFSTYTSPQVGKRLRPIAAEFLKDQEVLAQKVGDLKTESLIKGARREAEHIIHRVTAEESTLVKSRKAEMARLEKLGEATDTGKQMVSENLDYVPRESFDYGRYTDQRNTYLAEMEVLNKTPAGRKQARDVREAFNRWENARQMELISERRQAEQDAADAELRARYEENKIKREAAGLSNEPAKKNVWQDARPEGRKSLTPEKDLAMASVEGEGDMAAAEDVARTPEDTQEEPDVNDVKAVTRGIIEARKQKGVKNAVQKPGTEKVDVQPETENGEAVGEGNTQAKVAAKEGKKEKVKKGFHSKTLAGEGTTRDAVLKALSWFGGEDVIGKRVEIVHSSKVPEGIRNGSEFDDTTQAVTYGGKVWMLTDRIAPGTERGVFLHEVGGHLGMRALLGNDLYEKLGGIIRQWVRSKGTKQEHWIARAAQARVEMAGTAINDRMDELIAYFIEEADKAGVDPTAEKSPAAMWMGRAWKAITKALKNFLSLPTTTAENLTAMDIQTLAYGAAKLALEDVTVGEGETQLNSQGLKMGPVDITSEAFKRWFSDSKVVDVEGKPLVVYHGTTKDFDAFQKGDIGYHFGTAAQADYSTSLEYDLNYRYRQSSHTLPVYLSIQNLLRVKDMGVEWERLPERLRTDSVITEAQFYMWQRKFTAAKDLPAKMDVTADFIQGLGYDGLVYRNEAEGLAQRGGDDSYMVFSPTQIKSAIGNTGQFSETDPRIQFSKKAAKKSKVRGDIDVATVDALGNSQERISQAIGQLNSPDHRTDTNLMEQYNRTHDINFATLFNRFKDVRIGTAWAQAVKAISPRDAIFSKSYFGQLGSNILSAIDSISTHARTVADRQFKEAVKGVVWNKKLRRSVDTTAGAMSMGMREWATDKHIEKLVERLRDLNLDSLLNQESVDNESAIEQLYADPRLTEIIDSIVNEYLAEQPDYQKGILHVTRARAHPTEKGKTVTIKEPPLRFDYTEEGMRKVRELMRIQGRAAALQAASRIYQAGEHMNLLIDKTLITAFGLDRGPASETLSHVQDVYTYLLETDTQKANNFRQAVTKYLQVGSWDNTGKKAVTEFRDVETELKALRADLIAKEVNISEDFNVNLNALFSTAMVYQAEDVPIYEKLASTIARFYIPQQRNAPFKVMMQLMYADSEGNEQIVGTRSDTYARFLMGFRSESEANSFAKGADSAVKGIRFTVLNNQGEVIPNAYLKSTQLKSLLEDTEVDPSPWFNARIFMSQLKASGVNLSIENAEKLTKALSERHDKALRRLSEHGHYGADIDSLRYIAQFINNSSYVIGENMYGAKVDALLNTAYEWDRRTLKNELRQMKAFRDSVVTGKANIDENDPALIRADAQIAALEEGLRLERFYGKDYKDHQTLFRDSVAAQRGALTDGGGVLDSVRKYAAVGILGGSIASIATNVLGVLPSSISLLASKNTKTGFGGGFGTTAAARAVTKALGDLGSSGIFLTRDPLKALDAKIAKMSDGSKKLIWSKVAEEMRQGKLQVGQALSVTQTAKGSTAAHSRAEQVIKAYMAPFTYSETLIRSAVFMASMELHLAKNAGRGALDSKDIAKAAGFADKIVTASQGNYSGWAKGSAMRNGLSGAITMFMHYPMVQLALLKNMSPKGRMIYLAILWALAGTDGLPGADTIKNLIDFLARSFPEIFKTTGWTAFDGNSRNWFNRTSDTIADAMTMDQTMFRKGILTWGTGADFSSRLGLADVMRGDKGIDTKEGVQDLLGPLWTSMTQTTNALGGAGKIAKNLLEGRTEAAEVYTERFLTKQIPVSAVRNLASGVLVARDGEVRTANGYLVSEGLGVRDAMWKMAGWQPRRVSEEYAAADMDLSYREIQINLQKDFNNLLIVALAEGKDSMFDALLDDMDKMNDIWDAAGVPLELKYNAASIRKGAIDARKSISERVADRIGKKGPLREFAEDQIPN